LEGRVENPAEKFPHTQPHTQTQSNSTSPEKLRDTHREREREKFTEPPCPMSHIRRERKRAQGAAAEQRTHKQRNRFQISKPKAVSLFSHRDKKCQV
jgi:hypothetical protein